MPWRGPAYDGEFPSLGHLVAGYIEARCAIPNGPRQGEPFLLTDEQYRFLVWHYRLVPHAVPDLDKPSRAFAYFGSQLVRPQKWGKGPLSAAICCAEADGPVLFAGWDANGEPVGRPWSTPLIQVTAVSEDQTDNVWRLLLPMIELGDFGADLNDTGETRINLRNGGRIEPVTASGRSRLGQQITFANQDQTESWLKSNGGFTLADNQRRNLAGMGGRWIETPNAWDPNENSVAQDTNESEVETIHRDFPASPPGSIRNKRERRKVIRHVYLGCWWIDQDRIDADCERLLARDPGQAERFFLNRVFAGSDVAFDVDTWRRAARPLVGVRRKERVTLGFDGARFHDSTALIACRLRDGHVWPLGIWERPDGAADWEVPEHEVHAAVLDAFDRYDVWRMYADPPHWQDQISAWHGMFGDAVFSWWTSRDTQMALAVRRFYDALSTGALTHDGDRQLSRHIANARKRTTRVRDDETGQLLWVIQKDRPQSPNKIDGATAAVLAVEARAAAIAAGAADEKKPARLVSF